MFPRIDEREGTQDTSAVLVEDEGLAKSEEGEVIVRYRPWRPSLYFVTRTESQPHATPPGVTPDSVRKLRERIRQRHPGRSISKG
jgi:hypothetical protein